MAERRMFSKRVINSARFLKMPPSSQLLYFHLGMEADDDGIVEAYPVMKKVGIGEDDLKILVLKNYVHVLNDDLVSYITDWTENNKIRADRKVDSVYKELLVQVLPDVSTVKPKPRADTGKMTGGQVLDVQWTSNGQPVDVHWTPQDRIGKDRIDGDIDNSLHSLSNLCQNPEDSDVREASFPTGNNGNSSLTEENRTDTEMPSETKKESFPSRIYQEVVNRYNDTCTSLPRCTLISDKRKKLIRACWKEYGEKIYEAFEKAEQSDFLSGRSGDWNGCGFDWLMNRNNMLKVLEDNYGNNRKKKNPVDDIMPYRFSNEEFHRQMEEIEKDPRYKGDGDITFMF